MEVHDLKQRYEELTIKFTRIALQQKDPAQEAPMEWQEAKDILNKLWGHGFIQAPSLDGFIYVG